jgi:hypothetical protein
MTVPVKDRREALLASTTLNGIDFVEIASPDQQTLRVHFLNHVALKGTVSNPQIIGGETIRTVAVNPINDATDWSVDAEGRPILTLTTVVDGDFSFYTEPAERESRHLLCPIGFLIQGGVSVGSRLRCSAAPVSSARR